MKPSQEKKIQQDYEQAICISPKILLHVLTNPVHARGEALPTPATRTPVPGISWFTDADFPACIR
jgi:hypothetical protein